VTPAFPPRFDAAEGGRPQIRASPLPDVCRLVGKCESAIAEASRRERASFGLAMLKNAVLFAAAACALVVFTAPRLTGLTPAPPAPAPVATVAAAPPPAAPSAPPAQAAPANFREVSIPSDAHGQFAAEVMLNGAVAHMLIDTGATVVSISAATAARIGATPAPGPQWIVQTANGKSTATLTVLRSLSFGGIYMNDVEALILAPEAGDVNLLGASFLKRLASVEQRNGLLVLRQ